MAVFSDGIGRPVLYTGKNGSITSINAVAGPNIENVRNIPGGSVYQDSRFQPYMYSQKCGNTTVYRSMDNKLIGTSVNLGNGRSCLLNNNGGIVGYSHKNGSQLSLQNGNFQNIGSWKD